MTKKRSGFTLAEMIIAVAILSVASVYVVQMLVVTKNLRTRSYEIDRSVRISKNILELISSGESVSDSNDDLLLKMKAEDGMYILNFDEDFNISDENNALYKLFMTMDTKDGLDNVNIKINRLKPYILDDKKSLEISDISSIKMQRIKNTK
ncbi:prepilin-type cleavage/methylation N-terminal domain protein [Peptostreptococcaceae bacterium AS15]|nr:prepilin-type cleavage/methylation N-terminal domain protein [[Eubacterium] yurii subsp. margaretiae ATCC 43715]EJP26107.1 prepilin-type cleavage/methylation N-terminal domain protein [Peptostreptococcaceae bacterium AS15]